MSCALIGAASDVAVIFCVWYFTASAYSGDSRSKLLVSNKFVVEINALMDFSNGKPSNLDNPIAWSKILVMLPVDTPALANASSPFVILSNATPYLLDISIASSDNCVTDLPEIACTVSIS